MFKKVLVIGGVVAATTIAAPVDPDAVEPTWDVADGHSRQVAKSAGVERQWWIVY